MLNTGLQPLSGKDLWTVGDGDQPFARFHGYQHVP